MFKDDLRVSVWDEIRQYGLRVFAKRLTPETLVEAAQIAGLNLGRGPLHLANLAWLGIAAAMHRSRNFADVLGMVLKLLFDSEQFASTSLGKAKRNGQRRRGSRKQSKHDPRRRDPTEVSEEAFAKARGKMPLSYWMALLLLLGKRFEAEHGQTVCWNGFRLLVCRAFDIGYLQYIKMNRNAGSHLTSISIHRLFAADDEVELSDFLYGLSESITCGPGIAPRKGPVRD